MTGRKLFLVALVIVAGAIVVAVVRRAPSDKVAPTSRQADPNSAAMPVYTARVEPRLLQERVTATGSVTADESVELVSEIAGKVVAMAFDEGSRVKRGDVLVKLEDAELAAQLARAQSRVALARAQAERQKQLVAAGGTSQAEVDAAESEVKVLEAEVELARALLAKTEVRAPFDGAVGLRYVSVGANITPNTRIATLQKIDTIKVEFSIAERHLDRVRPDAEVQISVTGLSEPFKGKIYAVEPRIDPSTRTLRLRARAENPGGKALPGGFATVVVPLQEIPDALMVPADAIISGLNEQQVYVLENGRAELRTVRTGLRLARDVQVVSGLEPGAIVITSGQLQLRPGVAVVPVERPGSVNEPVAAAVSP
jgi:membrane fusion protein (multidrug efflux system)